MKMIEGDGTRRKGLYCWPQLSQTKGRPPSKNAASPRLTGIVYRESVMSVAARLLSSTYHQIIWHGLGGSDKASRVSHRLTSTRLRG